MFKRKRLVPSLAVFLLIAATAGCGKKEESQPSQAPPPPSQTAPSPPSAAAPASAAAPVSAGTPTAGPTATFRASVSPSTNSGDHRVLSR